MGAVVYAETFGNLSEVWMHRQIAATGAPLLTHAYLHRDRFPLDRVRVVERRATQFDRFLAGLRWLRSRHGYRLPASIEKQVAAQMRELGATVIHAHYGPAGARIAPVAKALGCRLLVTFHGFDASELPTNDPAFRRVLPKLARRADRLIAVSEAIRERLLALGCPPDKVDVIPLGVPLPEPPMRPREGEGPVRAITVARLQPKKGIPDLVDAIAATRARGARLALDIVGEGPERAEIERRVKAHGLDAFVRLHGAVPPAAVQEMLTQADLFVLNSRTSDSGDSEGLPISILEAMAAALPVVSTRHSGIPEAVLEGRTGLLVAEKDTAALADAVGRIAGDACLRHALGAAGRERAEEAFDFDRCVARLGALYAGAGTTDERDKAPAHVPGLH